MASTRKLAVIAALWLAASLPTGARTEEPTKIAAGTPSVELPTMRIDLGKVYERDKYEYSFAVRNKGTANLVIDVKPGCGCTAAKFDSVIAPGGQGTIALVIDGHKVDGDFAKQATVLTNDPKYPELTLMIAGSKIPFLTVTPPGRFSSRGSTETRSSRS